MAQRLLIASLLVACLFLAHANDVLDRPSRDLLQSSQPRAAQPQAKSSSSPSSSTRQPAASTGTNKKVVKTITIGKHLLEATSELLEGGLRELQQVPARNAKPARRPRVGVKNTQTRVVKQGRHLLESEDVSPSRELQGIIRKQVTVSTGNTRRTTPNSNNRAATPARTTGKHLLQAQPKAAAPAPTPKAAPASAPKASAPAPASKPATTTSTTTTRQTTSPTKTFSKTKTIMIGKHLLQAAPKAAAPASTPKAAAPASAPKAAPKDAAPAPASKPATTSTTSTTRQTTAPTKSFTKSFTKTVTFGKHLLESAEPVATSRELQGFSIRKQVTVNSGSSTRRTTPNSNNRAATPARTTGKHLLESEDAAPTRELQGMIRKQITVTSTPSTRRTTPNSNNRAATPARNTGKHLLQAAPKAAAPASTPKAAAPASAPKASAPAPASKPASTSSTTTTTTRTTSTAPTKSFSKTIIFG